MKERLVTKDVRCKISAQMGDLDALAPGWAGVGEPGLSIGEVGVIVDKWLKTSSLSEDQVFPVEYKFYSYRDTGMPENIWVYEVKLVSFGEGKPADPVDHYLVVLPNGNVLSEVCRGAS